MSGSIRFNCPWIPKWSISLQPLNPVLCGAQTDLFSTVLNVFSRLAAASDIFLFLVLMASHLFSIAFQFFFFFFNKATPFLNAALLRAIKKGYKMQEQAVINGLEEARLGREGTLFFCRPFFFHPFDVHCTLRPIVCVIQWHPAVSAFKTNSNNFFYFFYHVLPLATHLRKFTLMLILVL